jgi:hypothetical protein
MGYLMNIILLMKDEEQECKVYAKNSYREVR